MSIICNYRKTRTGRPCKNTVEDSEDHCRAGHPRLTWTPIIHLNPLNTTAVQQLTKTPTDIEDLFVTILPTVRVIDNSSPKTPEIDPVTTDQSPQPLLFHGTDQDLPVGTILRPGVELGHAKHGLRHKMSEHVYLTKRIVDAADWAAMAAGDFEQYLESGKTKGHVYKVRPLGPIEPDPYKPPYEETGPQYRTTHAEIISEVKRF